MTQRIQIISFESRITACSESILLFRLNFSPSTSMSSSKTTSLKEFLWVLSGDLQFRSYRLSSTCVRRILFTATSSPKTSFWKVLTNQASRSSILDPAVLPMSVFTLISNRGSIVRLRSFLVSLTQLPLICGVLAAFWPSFSLECPYSQEKVSKNSCPSLWKSSDYLITVFLGTPQGKMTSSILRPMSRSSQLTPKMLCVFLARSLSTRSWCARVTLSTTSSPSASSGTPKSVSLHSTRSCTRGSSRAYHRRSSSTTKRCLVSMKVTPKPNRWWTKLEVSNLWISKVWIRAKARSNPATMPQWLTSSLHKCRASNRFFRIIWTSLKASIRRKVLTNRSKNSRLSATIRILTGSLATRRFSMT